MEKNFLWTLLFSWLVGFAFIAFGFAFFGPGIEPLLPFGLDYGNSWIYFQAIPALFMALFLVLLLSPFLAPGGGLGSSVAKAAAELFFSLQTNIMANGIALVAALILAGILVFFAGLNAVETTFALGAIFFFIRPIVGFFLSPQKRAVEMFADRIHGKEIAQAGGLDRVSLYSEGDFKNPFSKSTLASMLLFGLFLLAVSFFAWFLAIFAIVILAAFFWNTSAKKIKSLEIGDGKAKILEFNGKETVLPLSGVSKIFLGVCDSSELTAVSIMEKKFAPFGRFGFIKKKFTEAEEVFLKCTLFKAKQTFVNKKQVNTIFELKSP